MCLTGSYMLLLLVVFRMLRKMGLLLLLLLTWMLLNVMHRVLLLRVARVLMRLIHLRRVPLVVLLHLLLICVSPW
jgi:hypothetical protein